MICVYSSLRGGNGVQYVSEVSDAAGIQALIDAGKHIDFLAGLPGSSSAQEVTVVNTVSQPVPINIQEQAIDVAVVSGATALNVTQTANPLPVVQTPALANPLPVSVSNSLTLAAGNPLPVRQTP